MTIQFGKIDRKFRFEKEVIYIWERELDEEFFSGFFEDKKVILNITKRKPIGSDVNEGVYACVTLEEPEISLNPNIIQTRYSEEVRDTLAHEMLHIFLYSCHPRGRNSAWGDNSKPFVEWCRFIRCPVHGHGENESPRNHFKICLYCGMIADAGHKRCRNCRKVFFKTYRKY